jgi:hypothetical protein
MKRFLFALVRREAEKSATQDHVEGGHLRSVSAQDYRVAHGVPVDEVASTTRSQVASSSEQKTPPETICYICSYWEVLDFGIPTLSVGMRFLWTCRHPRQSRDLHGVTSNKTTLTRSGLSIHAKPSRSANHVINFLEPHVLHDATHALMYISVGHITSAGSVAPHLRAASLFGLHLPVSDIRHRVY